MKSKTAAPGVGCNRVLVAGFVPVPAWMGPEQTGTGPGMEEGAGEEVWAGTAWGMLRRGNEPRHVWGAEGSPGFILQAVGTVPGSGAGLRGSGMTRSMS